MQPLTAMFLRQNHRRVWNSRHLQNNFWILQGKFFKAWKAHTSMSDEYSDDFDEDEVKKKSLAESNECMIFFENR